MNIKSWKKFFLMSLLLMATANCVTDDAIESSCLSADETEQVCQKIPTNLALTLIVGTIVFPGGILAIDAAYNRRDSVCVKVWNWVMGKKQTPKNPSNLSDKNGTKPLPKTIQESNTKKPKSKQDLANPNGECWKTANKVCDAYGEHWYVINPAGINSDTLGIEGQWIRSNANADPSSPKSIFKFENGKWNLKYKTDSSTYETHLPSFLRTKDATTIGACIPNRHDWLTDGYESNEDPQCRFLQSGNRTWKFDRTTKKQFCLDGSVWVEQLG